MKDEITQCPICHGLGSMRFKIWRTDAIIEKILEIKDYEPYEPEEELPVIIDIMKIECPLCEGDGVFDWILNITKGCKRRFESIPESTV